MNENVTADTNDFQLFSLLNRVTVATRPTVEAQGNRLIVLEPQGVPRLLHGDEGRLEKALVQLTHYLSASVSGADITLVSGFLDSGPDRILVGFGFRLVEGPSLTVWPEGDRSAELGFAKAILLAMGSSFEGPLSENGAMVVRFSVPLLAPNPKASGFHLPEGTQARRVLIAEDNRVTQIATAKLLERRGHEVHLAGDGMEAVEKASEMPFDVILMDLDMPELDGLAAAQRIKAQQGSALPIVAYTVHTLTEDRMLCWEVGVDGFLAKPVSCHDLFQEVERWPRRNHAS